jgi:hypothetical protein
LVLYHGHFKLQQKRLKIFRARVVHVIRLPERDTCINDIIRQLSALNIADDFFNMVEMSDVEFDVMHDEVLTKSEALFVVNSIIARHQDSQTYDRSVVQHHREKIMGAFDKSEKSK